MIYQIRITKTAERDLEDALNYIEFNLKNPIAADNLLNKAQEKISMLSDFPEAHALIDDPVLSIWGIRLIPIDNYLAFYTIIGDTVYIVRFLYGKRDWASILKQGISFK